MMQVVFQHPPTGTSNPFNNFVPSNTNHYPNCSGIYIYGLRLVVGRVKKFVPLYVGIGGNIFNRLYTHHYLLSKTSGKSKKELFDFSLPNFHLNDVRDRYSEMLIYDVATNRRYRIQQPLVFNLPHLVYFQSSCIYNYKFSLPAIGDVNHVDAIQHLRKYTQNNAAKTCADNIENTKAKFDDDFYFVYASLYDGKHVVVENDLNEKFKITKKFGKKGDNYLQKELNCQQSRH